MLSHLDQEKTLIALWEVRGGKRFIRLMQNPIDFTYEYRTENGYGFIGKFASNDLAIAHMETQVAMLKLDFPSTKRTV